MNVKPWDSALGGVSPTSFSPTAHSNQVLVGSHRWGGGSYCPAPERLWRGVPSLPTHSFKALTKLEENSEYLQGSHRSTGGVHTWLASLSRLGRWNYLQPWVPLFSCSPEPCWQVEWMLFLRR